MSEDKNDASQMTEGRSLSNSKTAKGLDRRRFLGKVGTAAAVVTGALASPSVAFGQSSSSQSSGVGTPSTVTSHNRVLRAFETRVAAASREALIPVPAHATNGDEARYPDKSGTYSKGLLQDGYGRVNLHAFNTFRKALNSGKPSDFEKIILGGTRTLNGPQGAYCYGMAGCDGVQFGNAPSPANQESVVLVPPPPATASAANGTELVELYWCSLLRDAAF